MYTQERRPETDDGRAPGGDAPGALSPKQELALQALLSHPTLKEAAAAAGVGDATLWRYMQDPEFSRRLREARREAVGHAALRLQGGAGEAVAVLRDLMTREGAPPAARITAARTVLDYSFRVVEMDELRARLDELERFILRKQEEDALDRGGRPPRGTGSMRTRTGEIRARVAMVEKLAGKGPCPCCRLEQAHTRREATKPRRGSDDASLAVASRCEFCGTPFKQDLSGYPEELREVAGLYYASDLESLFTDPRVWAARRWMAYWAEARRQDRRAARSGPEPSTPSDPHRGQHGYEQRGAGRERRGREIQTLGCTPGCWRKPRRSSTGGSGSSNGGTARTRSPSSSPASPPS